MFKVVSEDLDIRNFLERKRGIKFHRPIDIADGHADRFDGDLWRLRDTKRGKNQTAESNEIPSQAHHLIGRKPRNFLTRVETGKWRDRAWRMQTCCRQGCPQLQAGSGLPGASPFRALVFGLVRAPAIQETGN